MSGKGHCYDKAQAESFFARCKTELLEGGVFRDVEEARSEFFIENCRVRQFSQVDVEEARSEFFSYIEGYYNRVRLHSSLSYRTPLALEQALQQQPIKEKRNF